MRQLHVYAGTVLALVCLSPAGLIAQQNFPSTPDAAPLKPHAAEKDAGFAPPETVAPNTTHAAEQSTDFKPPETVTPSELPAKVQPTAISSGTLPLMGSARGHFMKATAMSDPRTPGAEPFILHAIFTAPDDAVLKAGGTYSETWFSPTSWRREASAGNVHLTEARDGDRMYRSIRGADWVPRRMDDLMDALERTLPVLDDTFIEADWQQGSVLYEGATYLRLSNASGDARTYWLDENGRVRAAYENATTTEYTDYEDFHGKQIARHINVRNGSAKLGGIWIDQLEPAAATPTARFTVDGAEAIPLSDNVPYNGPYFVPPQPVYRPAPANPPAGEGVLSIDVHLDAHGHVRSAKVRKGINAALDEVALQTAYEWEFTPARLKGRPTPSDATVQFQF